MTQYLTVFECVMLCGLMFFAFENCTPTGQFWVGVVVFLYCQYVVHTKRKNKNAKNL